MNYDHIINIHSFDESFKSNPWSPATVPQLSHKRILQVALFIHFCMECKKKTSQDRTGDLAMHRAFLDEKKRMQHLLLHPPTPTPVELSDVISAGSIVLESASQYHDGLAKVHLEVLGKQFCEMLATKHSSCLMEVDGASHWVLNFMPWALFIRDGSLKSFELSSLGASQQDVTLIEKKVLAMSGLPKMHDHSALLLFPAPVRRHLQVAQRLHSWQVSTAEAVQALWSARRPGSSGSPGSPGGPVLCDPAYQRLLQAVLDAQAAMEALLPLPSMEAEEDGELAAMDILLPIVQGSSKLVAEGRDITKQLIDAFVAESCRILGAAEASLKKMMPAVDMAVMLAPKNQRDNERIVKDILNNASLAALAKRMLDPLG